MFSFKRYISMNFRGVFFLIFPSFLQPSEGSYFDWSNSNCRSVVTGGYASGGYNSPLEKQSVGLDNEIDHPKNQPFCRDYLTGKGSDPQYPGSISKPNNFYSGSSSTFDSCPGSMSKPNNVYSGMSSTFDSCHRNHLFSFNQGSGFCRDPVHEPLMYFGNEFSSGKTCFKPIGSSVENFAAACKGINTISKETTPRQSSNKTPSPKSQTTKGTNAPVPYDLMKKITKIRPENKTTKPYTELLDPTGCGMKKYDPDNLMSYLKKPVVVRRYVFAWPGSKFSITYYGYGEKMAPGGARTMWKIANCTAVFIVRKIYDSSPNWIRHALKALKYSFIPPENKRIKVATSLERRYDMYQANLHFIYSRTQEQIRRHTFKWPGTTVTITFYGIPKARERDFPSKVFKSLVTSISDARYRLLVHDDI